MGRDKGVKGYTYIAALATYVGENGFCYPESIFMHININLMRATFSILVSVR